MIFDTHMHTRFSTDSKMTIEQAVAAGEETGLGIILTEHMDLDYPKPQAFIFDIDEYFAEYERYRSNAVLLGIEIGMREELVAASRAKIDGYRFDYVLGSIHVVTGIDIYMEEYYNGRTKREVYGQYFKAMIDCVASHDFIDSLGHVDYIARYARFEDAEVRYSEFGDYIDKVLGLVIEKEKVLEINTRRLDQPRAAAELIPIYRRYAELGGRWVTIGSDAHNPHDIGKNFSAALEIAEICRLKPIWFKDREPRYMK